MVDGNRGELTVLVDGREVAKKGLLFKPTAEKILASVRETSSATTEAKT